MLKVTWVTSSDIVQFPILGMALCRQTFNWTPSQLLWQGYNHAEITAQRQSIQTSTTIFYSFFLQWTEKYTRM